ncbi:MAG: hypothetical protein FWG07_11020 [Treponema sp.]|nr:hypothetical protein [Treponema sp.]
MDMIENHLNYNPWLRGIYDEANRIAANDPGTVLEPGLSEDDLYLRAETIRYGDYKFNNTNGNRDLINNEATAVPEAYFCFLRLIGGFNCRSVQLYHLGKEYLYNDHGRNTSIANVVGPSVREKVITGETQSYHVKFELSYPLQVTLGKCDHGEYVYDRRNDSYSLIGFDRTTNFKDCGEMLNHALYRARENIKENWKASQ